MDPRETFLRFCFNGVLDAKKAEEQKAKDVDIANKKDIKAGETYIFFLLAQV